MLPQSTNLGYSSSQYVTPCERFYSPRVLRCMKNINIPGTRLTFAIAANEDDTLVRLLKNLNILNKKYPIFDFDFDGFDSRVPAYRSPYSS